VQIRANLRRANREQVREALQAEGVASEPTKFSPSGLTLTEPGGLEKLHSFSRGIWQVQDEAAQCSGFLARPEGGTRLLDACAAPGGKACHLLERMDPGARLLAIDFHANKLDKIRTEARRLGLEGALELRARDATQPLDSRFDRVLVDAPCSGLGTLRRHPELRYRRKPEDIARLAELQAQILRSVAASVEPGGLLTYAVCSTTAEEGPRQIERLLAELPGFSRAGREGLPDSLQALVNDRGELSTWPHRHEMDGFWAASLRRE
jgi:16S rRNA (cytosine967-C5)-methyltransferase